MEKVQADSFFTWGAAQVVEDIISDQEETMEEALGAGKALKGCLKSRLAKTDQNDPAKVYVRFLMHVAYVGMLPQMFVLSIEAAKRRLCEYSRSHAVIIRFIHTQDGEKESDFEILMA